MLALSTPSDKAIRAQIAESISIIATSDFPDLWPDLVDVSIYLSTTLAEFVSKCSLLFLRL